MLIEFTVGNYRSFKDKKTLRMDAATSVSEHRENLISEGKHKLLRSAVLYGANASGKSNLLRAMGLMRSNVLHSASRSSSDDIKIEPFLLTDTSEHRPSYFEAIFWINHSRYRYGFEIDKQKCHSEWLFESKREVEKPLFIRENEDIQISKLFKEGKGLEAKTKPNSLFISVCDQFNGFTSAQIVAWFNSLSVSPELTWLSRNWTIDSYFDEKLRGEAIAFIKKLDLSIEKIILKSENHYTQDFEGGDNYEMTLLTAKTIHQKFNEFGEPIETVEFDMEEAESSGTNKLFDLSGPIFYCLQKGSLFIADELDAKLHPLMTRAIVRLFNDPATNPNNAQIIFATHDTNLLSYGNFRRDQIYFTEKDQYGATDLYSLAEFKEEGNGKVRKDRSFYKDYMQGRYGAVPHIGNFENLLNPSWQKSEAEANQ
ncbi:MAG: ATP-binding protein [Phycisphaerae bacterium]|nr:ATP-binding protein [Saprospiraceae bacterium]